VNGNVNATATIGGVTYSTNTQTDASGNYTLPVINGTWQVSANANNFMNPDPVNAVISGSNATVNFTLLTALENWRKSNFNSPSNSATGADLADPDYDGIVSLLEFAFGLNPTQNSAGLLPQAQRSGNNLVISFTEPSGMSGITYGGEWSSNMLPGSWTSVPDTGSAPQHTFSVAVGNNKTLVMRLRITSP